MFIFEIAGATCIVVVRPGCATSLSAKGSFDLGSMGVEGEAGSLRLESHDTALDAELYELKLWMLILSENLSLMFSLASFSTALSSSRLRIVEHGDEALDGGEGDNVRSDSWIRSSGKLNLFHGLSRSFSIFL